MTDLLSALLLGVIEGLTEFLPISSTGHLLIAQHFLQDPRSDFFNIVIQAGAILAITLVFRQRLWDMARSWRSAETRDYVAKIAAAFLVTALVGLPVRLAGWQLPDTVTPIAWALILGGVWMLLAEHYAGRRGDDVATVTWKVAILVGLAQVVAGVFPGTSRSAAAIFMAMLAGTTRRSSATEFVFLVGIPTMFAASGYAFLELLMGEGEGMGGEDWTQVGVAFAAATVTGFLVVKWLLGYIKSHRYTVFAVYRLILGAGLLLLMPTGT